jgi:hypothetical protein
MLKEVALGISFIFAVASGSALAEDNRKVIQECVERVGQNVEAVRRGGLSKYESDYLSIVNGAPHIDATVDLRYPFSYMSRDEMNSSIDIMEISKGEIVQFYAENGIKLNLTFNHQIEKNPWSPKDNFVVNLRRNMEDAMQSTFWGVNAHWDIAMRGQIHGHEFSHLLGLEDEYESPNISKRLPPGVEPRIGEDDNIMAHWDAKEARLYPHQIELLLAPICSNGSVAKLN